MHPVIQRVGWHLTMVMSALLMVVALAPQPAAADGSWLDGTPTQWNTPGMAIPQAPPREPAAQQRCFDALVVPDTAAKRALVAAGWFLFNSPASSGAGVEIVHAQSSADGMCRPAGYQTFVFVDGVFAGTLSPVLMDSRVDGALNRASLAQGDQIQAEYVRYTRQDPLCCPYAHTTATFEIAKFDGAPAVRLLRAGTVPNTAPTTVPPSRAPVQAPVQVPRGR
jgi:hypothetical protein